MKHGWIALLFTACVVRVNPPFHLPSPDPDGEPTSAGIGPPPVRGMEGGPRGQRRSPAAEPFDDHKNSNAGAYYSVHYYFDEGAKEEAAHQDDEAASSYRTAVRQADRLLDSLQRYPNPARIYSTSSDGVMDEPTLTAKTRELRARAQALSDAAEQRYHAALFAEYHPKTEEQRKVLLDHGRAEVLHRNGEICWLYLRSGVREVFCWNRSGQLADHTRVEEEAASE
jgi:hypothetical protein